MFRKTNKVISIVLTVAILVSCLSISSFASDESAKTTDVLLKEINKIPEIALERYPDIATVINKIKDYCKTEKDYEKVEKFIKSSKEYQAIETKYGNSIEINEDQSKLANLEELMKTDEFKAQEKAINELAKKYYEFYKINGYYPDEEGNNENGFKLNSAYVLPSDGVVIMEQLGYTMTVSQLSTTLAELAAAALLDGPLPVADCIALVAGAAVLTYFIYTNVTAHQTAVCNVLTNRIGYTASQNAARAVANSAIYWYNRYNYTYFDVWLNNNACGGITFVSYVSYAAAQSIVLKDSMFENVFAANASDALTLANACSTISPATHDSAHYNTSYGFQPNNLPHYHRTVVLFKMDGHCFHL